MSGHKHTKGMVRWWVVVRFVLFTWLINNIQRGITSWSICRVPLPNQSSQLSATISFMVPSGQCSRQAKLPASVKPSSFTRPIHKKWISSSSRQPLVPGTLQTNRTTPQKPGLISILPRAFIITVSTGFRAAPECGSMAGLRLSTEKIPPSSPARFSSIAGQMAIATGRAGHQRKTPYCRSVRSNFTSTRRT